MSLSPRGLRLPILRVIAFVSALSCAGAAQSQESKPFSGLAGNWAGGGTIAVSGGVKERIRCRAHYDVGKSGTAFQLRLRCASDSYKFDLQGDVSHQNGEVIGNWSEKTNGIAGRVAGSVKGAGQFDVRVESSAFSALMTVRTRGNRQSISIKAAGKEMSESHITLSHGR
jgi:hypothetical protein